VTETLYEASLAIEEQRPIRLRAVIANPADLQKSDFKPMLFSSPRAFAVPELIKLAPALDSDKTLVGVGSPPNLLRGLYIWGVADVGSSWSKAIHGGGYVMPDFPDALIVSATEAASLTFARHQHVLAAVRRGRLVLPEVSSLHKGPLADFFRRPRIALGQTIHQMIEEDRPGFRHGGHDYATRYTSVVERLLFQIRAQGHGGAVLVVPHEIAAGDARLTSLVHIKYRAERNGMWVGLASSVSHHVVWHELDRAASRPRTPLRGRDYVQTMSMYGQWHESDEVLTDEINLVARLAGVDGAIVMTDQFKLLGFGAEFVATIDLPRVVVARNPEGKGSTRSVERFGQRHRSAFRFCASTPFPSVAFVVSQDGGIKAVKQVDSKLVMWEEVTTGEFAM